MSDIRVTAPDSLPPSLELAGQLIVHCNGATDDDVKLEVHYVIPLGPKHDAAFGGSHYYELVPDKVNRTIAYVLTTFGVRLTLAFDQSVPVSKPLVLALVHARENHSRKLAEGDSSPTCVMRGLTHTEGAELIAHLSLLGLVSATI